MSCCTNCRKPVPVLVGRGDTLRCAWLRAPPRSTTTSPKLKPGCLTQDAPYEGGLSRAAACPPISVRQIRVGAALRAFAHPTLAGAPARPQAARLRASSTRYGGETHHFGERVSGFRSAQPTLHLLSGQSGMSAGWSLWGEEQTSAWPVKIDANDPKRTLGVVAT